MQNNAERNQQLLETLMKQLSPADQKRVEALLSDKKACQQILNSPEAQKLMREWLCKVNMKD